VPEWLAAFPFPLVRVSSSPFPVVPFRSCLGLNARLVYRLSTQSIATRRQPPPSTIDAFRVDAESGQLTTVVDLRGHRRSEFVVDVVVSDRGSPPLSSAAPLRVVVVGPEVVELRRTDVHEGAAEELPETSWEGGAVAQLLALSGDELALIGAFVLSAVFVSVCVVVVCAARCDRKHRRHKLARQPPEVAAAVGDASVDSPLMTTSLAVSDSTTTSDGQVRIHRCDVCTRAVIYCQVTSDRCR